MYLLSVKIQTKIAFLDLEYVFYMLNLGNLSIKDFVEIIV